MIFQKIYEFFDFDTQKQLIPVGAAPQNWSHSMDAGMPRDHAQR